MTTVLLLASLGAWAQATPDVEQGMKPYGSYHGGDLDHISLTNGNLFFQADLFSYSQRGGELAYPIVLRYNNKVFSLFEEPCPPAQPHCLPTETMIFGPNPLRSQKKSNGNSVTVGYEGLPSVAAGFIDTSVSFDGTEIFVQPLSVVMPDGSTHQLVTTNSGLTTIDGSGYAAPGNGPLTGRDGTSYGVGGALAQDRNGNLISFDGTAKWTDTLGRAIPGAPTPGTPNATTASLSACPALNYPFQAVAYAYTWNLPTVSGGTLPLILCYTNVWVRTGSSFGPTTFDVNQAFPMLQSVMFPDKTYWAFQYDAADPNNTSSIGFGDLLKVTLPTGGSITYTWQNWGSCVSQFTPPGGSFSRAVQTRSVDAGDGTGLHVWQYSYSLQLTATSLTGQTVVTDAANNDTVHVITGLGATCSLYETQTQYYQGLHTSGPLLKTITTDYQYTVNPYDPVAISMDGTNSFADSVTNVFPIRVTATLPNGKVSKVEMDYDSAVAYHGPVDGITSNVNECPSSGGGGSGQTLTDPPSDNPPTGGGCWGAQQTNPVTNYTGSYGKVVAKREYDWGQGAPGPLLRQTKTTYKWQVDSAYLSANLLDLPASVQVLDGNSAQVALTTYNYDEYSLNGSQVTTQFGSAPNSVRGNLTSVYRWLNGSAASTPNCPIAVSNGSLVTYAQYNDTGTVYRSTDACGTALGDPHHTTTHTYDPAFDGAYPTQTCNPLGQCVSGTYDFNTGLLTSLTDANQQTSNFGYDSLWRLTQVLGPKDPVTGLRPETDFDHSVMNQVKRTKRQSPNASSSTGLPGITDYAYFDGLGRTKQTRLVDPEGDDFVDTTYDALGRVSTVSNPHGSGSSPTDGITTTYYDALGRVVHVTKQDGSLVSTDYSQFPVVIVTDEAGKVRKSQSDGLGRLVEVDEPGTVPPQNDYAVLQSDGNFVLYQPSGTVSLWASGTAGSAANNLALQSDGNLVLYGPKWQTGVQATPAGSFTPQSWCSIGATLFWGQKLMPGSCLTSPQGQYDLAMQADGNLVLYNFASGSQVSTWSSGTAGNPGAWAFMQTDGNFVVYSSAGVALWSSGTFGVNVQWLALQDNGLAVLYGGVWWTGTNQPGTASLSHPSCDIGSNLGWNGTIPMGSCLVSPNGRYVLAMEADGNLALYDNAQTPQKALWWTGTEAATPLSPGIAWVTAYAYDALGNLTRVDQKGSAPNDSTQWRTRLFTYDSLSRLLTAQNPESGAITYTYDSAGNVLTKTSPAPNQQGTATEAISYCYDVLNRMVAKGYASPQPCSAAPPYLPNPAAVYTYDTGAYAIGHLSSLTDQAGSGAYSYDPLGRMVSEQRTIAGISKSMSYGYNLDGSLASLTYPSNATVTYTPDSAGHMLKAVDTANGINYATSATYAPDGSIASFTSGGTITNSFSYNKRLQPVNMSASSPTGTVFSLNYDFHLGAGNNGNVWGITNNKDNSRNQTFTYDALNRLTSAQNAGTDCSQGTVNGKSKFWGNGYSYDAWGNLFSKGNLPGSTSAKCTPESLDRTVDAQNRLHVKAGADYQYDAAGNMTYDAVGQYYAYDPENRITGANGFTYTYDADGNRVEKINGSTGTLYWYMSPGIVAESDLAGNLQSEYVFFDGERVARRDNPGTSSSTVSYYFSDHLKTTDIVTDAQGNIKNESDFYPWGGELQFVANDSNHYKFTGKERDNETGLDYFGARYYSSGLGRWISADWSATPIDVPYADFNDPQTLNLYSFVRNLPTTKADVDGHGWLDLLLKGIGLAGDTALAADNAPKVVSSKSTVSDRIEGALNLGSIVFAPLAVGPRSGNPGKFADSLGEKLGITNSSKVSSVKPLESTPATEPYKRPSNATTSEQRASVQGKPCSSCGQTEDKMVANHKDSLVEQHYRDGSVDATKMHDVTAVDAHCSACSARQGGFLSAFSKQMKKVLKSIRE